MGRRWSEVSGLRLRGLGVSVKGGPFKVEKVGVRVGRAKREIFWDFLIVNLRIGFAN